MPQFSANQLVDIADRILKGAGVGAQDARIVAVELADAHSVGSGS